VRYGVVRIRASIIQRLLVGGADYGLGSARVRVAVAAYEGASEAVDDGAVDAPNQ
jgi:hypothetical protein